MLRDYQEEAIAAFKKNDVQSGVIIMPTGSGKSHVCAEIVKMYKRPLVIVPTRELVDQNASKIPGECRKWYTGSKALTGDVIITTAASAISKADQIKEFNPDVCIVDEAHRLSMTNEIGKLLRSLSCKFVGLTATPYRNNTGHIYGKQGRCFFEKRIFEVRHQRLIKTGSLVPRRYLKTKECISKDIYKDVPISKMTEDYSLSKLSTAIMDQSKVCLDSLPELKSGLIFCVDVKHAEEIGKYMNCPIIKHDTKKKAREEILRRFRSGEEKFLANVATLTTGFDYPALDAIILLRPTKSIVLYEQICGRGDRPCEGKIENKIYDFADSFPGLVACSITINPCKFCGEIIDYKYNTCSECGKELYPKNCFPQEMEPCPYILPNGSICGVENIPQAKRCKGCGSYLGKWEVEEDGSIIKLSKMQVTFIDKNWIEFSIVEAEGKKGIDYHDAKIHRDDFEAGLFKLLCDALGVKEYDKLWAGDEVDASNNNVYLQMVVKQSHKEIHNIYKRALA